MSFPYGSIWPRQRELARGFNRRVDEYIPSHVTKETFRSLYGEGQGYGSEFRDHLIRVGEGVGLAASGRADEEDIDIWIGYELSAR